MHDGRKRLAAAGRGKVLDVTMNKIEQTFLLGLMLVICIVLLLFGLTYALFHPEQGARTAGRAFAGLGGAGVTLLGVTQLAHCAVSYEHEPS